MPQIPFYPREQHAQFHPVQPAENPQAGRAAGQTARVLDEFGTRLQAARTRRDISSAQNDAYDQLSALRQKVTESGDWQNGAAEYEKGAQQIHDNIAKKYPHVSAQVLPSVDHATIAGKYDIDRWAWGHEQDHSRAQYTESVKANVQRAVNAQTPEERQLYKQQIVDDSAAAAGSFVTEVQADSMRDGALSDVDKLRAEHLIESNPAQAVSMLGNSKEFTDLDPDTRIVLQHRADRVLKSRQAQARAELSSRLSDDIVSIERTGQGVPGIDQQMADAGYSAEDIADHKHRQEMAFTMYGLGANMKLETPEQIHASVESLKPEPGAVDFKTKYQLYVSGREQEAKVLAARKADPQGYAWATHPPAATTLEGKIDEGLAQQTALGVPKDEQRVLPKAVADNLVQQWKTAKPDQKVALLNEITDGAGKHAHAVLHQLIHDGLPIGAGVMMHASADVRDDMAQALGMNVSELRKAVPNAATVEDEAGQDVQDFINTLPPNIELRGRYLQLTKHMALFYAARGDDNPGEEAVANLYGNYFDYQGTLRIPKGRGYDPVLVANMATYVQKHLEGPLMGRGQPEGYVQNWRAPTEGVWITNSDGDGATLYLQHAPVLKADGTPVTINFKAAATFDFGEKTGLANPHSRVSLPIVGTVHSPLAYKGAPLVPEEHIKSATTHLLGKGQVLAGGKKAPPSVPGSLVPGAKQFLREYFGQFATGDRMNAATQLLQWATEPTPDEGKSK